ANGARGPAVAGARAVGASARKAARAARAFYVTRRDPAAARAARAAENGVAAVAARVAVATARRAAAAAAYGAETDDPDARAVLIVDESARALEPRASLRGTGNAAAARCRVRRI